MASQTNSYAYATSRMAPDPARLALYAMALRMSYGPNSGTQSYYSSGPLNQYILQFTQNWWGTLLNKTKGLSSTWVDGLNANRTYSNDPATSLSAASVSQLINNVASNYTILAHQEVGSGINALILKDSTTGVVTVFLSGTNVSEPLKALETLSTDGSLGAANFNNNVKAALESELGVISNNVQLLINQYAPGAKYNVWADSLGTAPALYMGGHNANIASIVATDGPSLPGSLLNATETAIEQNGLSVTLYNDQTDAVHWSNFPGRLAGAVVYNSPFFMPEYEPFINHKYSPTISILMDALNPANGWAFSNGYNVFGASWTYYYVSMSPNGDAQSSAKVTLTKPEKINSLFQKIDLQLGNSAGNWVFNSGTWTETFTVDGYKVDVTRNDDGSGNLLTRTINISDPTSPPGAPLIATETYNAAQGLDTQYITLAGGTVIKLSVNADTSGFAALQQSAEKYVSLQTFSMTDGAELAGDLSDSLGSSIGKLIANGNPYAQVAATTLIGGIGQKFAAELIAVGAKEGGLAQLNDAINITFQGIDQTLWSKLQGETIGTISSLLTMELGQDLGLKGFGAELVGTVGSTVLQQVLTSSASGASGAALFSNLNLSNITNPSEWSAALSSTAVLNSFGSFLGAQLGQLIVQPQNTTAGFLGSSGAALGALLALNDATIIGTAATAIGDGIATSVTDALFAPTTLAEFQASVSFVNGLSSILVPGVGALIGFVLGTLIGNLFGHSKPRIPTASAQTILQIPLAQYYVGNISSANGGNANLVTSIANSAAKTLNGILEQISGGPTPLLVANAYSPTQVYGHTGSQLWVKLGGAYAAQTNVNSGVDAVDRGVLWALPQTEVIGGDLYLKRAIHNNTDGTVTQLMGDLQVVSDYKLYLTQKEEVNSTIEAAPNSQFAAAWITSLSRANELGLSNWTPSDFFGGLYGFMQSFGLDGKGSVNLADVSVNWDGANLTVALPSSEGAGAFSILPQASADGSSVTIGGFGANVGYTTAAMGTGTSGATFETAKGSTAPVNFVNQQQVLIAQGYYDDMGNWVDTSYYQTQEGSGDTILIGGDGGNYIVGGAGYAWIQGGAGDNYLKGGSGKTVLVGGSGHNMLVAGSGDTVLIGGSGNNQPVWGVSATPGGVSVNNFGGLWGGAGNNTFIAGSGGTDAYASGSNKNLFIARENGQWNWFGGSGSNNWVSYQNFTHGVTADLTNANPFSWDANAKALPSVYVDNVQNLIGAPFASYLKSGVGGGILEGGGVGGNTFVGGGGTTTVSFANSTGGVYVDLSANIAYGAGATGDTFSNIQNIIGSNYADELRGLPGSVLTGGVGNEVFDFSGGGNAYNGGSGFNTVDYSTATASVYADLTGGNGYVAGLAGDTYVNISKIVGSPFGSNVIGKAQGATFVATGGASTFSGQGGDTIELDTGSGQVTVTDTNSLSNAINVGAGLTYDNLWIGTVGGSTGYLQIGVRGTSDVVTVNGNFGAYPVSGNDIIKTLNMNGASSLDIGQITYAIAGNGQSGQVLSGAALRYNMIFGYGGNNTIYAAGPGVYTYYGDVIVPGATVNGGSTSIVLSSGDDQIAYERGDGHFVISGISGGQKTIAFGPTVAATDVIYQVVGDDFYIGLRDPNNSSLTASQVNDNIRVIGGGDQYVDRADGSFLYQNTVNFVMAGGSSIDISKLNINWAIKKIRTGTGPGKPIIFDLTGDGLELSTAATSDIVTKDAKGVITRIAWVGPTNGILVTDRAGDGKYNTMNDISFVGDKKGATTDLEGLAGWDTNGDGVIDSKDAGWSKLKIWVDKNHDGRASSSELYSLSDLGITSINLKGTPTGFTSKDSADTYVSNTTTFTRSDGTTGTAYDVALGREFLGQSGPGEGNGVSWADLTANATIGQMLVDPATVAGADASGMSYKDYQALGTYDFSNSGHGMSHRDSDRWKAYLDPVEIKKRREHLAKGVEGDENLANIRATEGPQAKDPNRGSHAPLKRLQVLDLVGAGHGPNLESLTASQVSADVGRTGQSERIGWVGPSDSLLAVDTFGDSRIDIPTEASFQALKPDAKTSLAGLAAFDSNGDGVIDASDARFSQLRLWMNASQDGVSTASQLTSLTDAGIKSISLKAHNAVHNTGNLGENQILAQATVTYANGSTATLYDVALAVNDPNAKTKSTTANTTAAAPSASSALQPQSVSAPQATSAAADPTAWSPTATAAPGLAAVAMSQGSQDGPEGGLVAADPSSSGGAVASAWWSAPSSSALSLQNSIQAFQANGASSGASTSPAFQSPVNDAANLQQQLLLRQSIAGFSTGTGAAPALWTRNGSADTLATLAAASATQAIKAQAPAQISAGG